MSNPIGDTERSKLGEVTVIENQNEMRGLLAETFKHMGMPTREVPDVSWIAVVRVSLTSRVDYGCSNAAFEHTWPLGSCSMPVKLAHRAWLDTACDARDPLS